MSNTHSLKILPQYYADVLSGKKTFEVRKNDRDFQLDDKLILSEYENGVYTGATLMCRICYILDNEDYCKDGYVILGLTEVGKVTNRNRGYNEQ